MSNKINNSDFNILREAEYNAMLRKIWSVITETNKFLTELSQDGLTSFLTFDVTKGILKTGTKGLNNLRDIVIADAQKGVYLLDEKSRIRKSYEPYFKKHENKAQILFRDASYCSLLADYGDLLAWNDESKQIEFIKGYENKLKAQFTVTVQEYHVKYMELLNKYVDAKNELYKYHALVYAHNYPSRSGLIRLRGTFSDDGMVSFNSDTLEYSPIGLDKLLLTSIHEPDNESLLKEKIVTNW